MNTITFAKNIFGSSNIKGIEPINYDYKGRYKIVVYVPQHKTDELTFLMASAGAGVIGAYTLCSFRTKGTGTFLGGKSSNPTAGKKGKFEMVEEVRLEMLCDEPNLDAAIDAMYEVHPYEEPAYEIYPVLVRAKKPDGGVIAVSFKKNISLKTILPKINKLIDWKNMDKLQLNNNVSSAIIDFTGTFSINEEIKGRKKVLYIIKNSNSSYNIRLV